MMEGRTVVAVVPARGASKGVPRKNVREFLGKPLLAWTIQAATESGVLDRIVLSTEDREIAEAGKAWGAEVPFLRPAELAGDAVPTAPVVCHALDSLRRGEGLCPDYVMVLEPTGPARQPFHVREALELLIRSRADSLASISEVPHHFVPEKILKREADGTVRGVRGTPVRDMIHRRQDLPRHYAFNGLIFACRAAVLLESNPPTLWGERVVGYETDPKYNVDIDTPEDWVAGEAQMRRILGETRRG